MRRKRLIQVLILILISGMLGVSSCASVTAQTTAPAAPTTTAAYSSQTVSNTKETTESPKKHENSWFYENKYGYTFTFTIAIWDAVKDDGSGIVYHPENSTDNLENGINAFYDPDRDAIIPAQLSVENTTDNFDQELSARFTFRTEDGTPYDGKGNPPTYDDGRIQVVFFYSDGVTTKNFSSSNSWGYDCPDPTGIHWDNLVSGQTGTGDFYIIIKDYYSPATPNGDKAILDFITIRPLWGGEQGDNSFYCNDGAFGDVYAKTGMSLSGITH